MNQINKQDTLLPCGLFRRLVAIFYDCLLLFAVLFGATAILLPFTHGEAIHSENIFYFLYLTAWSFLFFGWAWTHGGQTLGMRAWKVKLLDSDNNIVTWKVAGKRFLLAMLSWAFMGLGFAWAIFDTDKRTFHDRYSGTRLYKINATGDKI